MGDLIISARKGDGAVHPLKDLAVTRLLTFPPRPSESFRAKGCAAYLFRRPFAMIGSIWFAEFRELYDLALFFFHAPLCPGYAQICL